MTTDEVAAALGLSRSHVSVIEAAALKKLRKECEERGLTFDKLALHIKHENAYVGHDDYE